MDKDEIATKIMDYLHKHPDAGDTLEGITKWWLGLEKIDESVDSVSKVIEELIKKGLVKKEELQGGNVFYKISKKEVKLV